MEINQTWIDEQRAVCEVATPGPWEVRRFGRYEDHDECDIDLHDDNIDSSKYENADFIAAARTALPAALDALEAAWAEIARLTAERNAAVSDMLVLVKSHCVCDACKHGRDNGEDRVPCEYEKWCSQQLWEWRGVSTANTDAPTGAETVDK